MTSTVAPDAPDPDWASIYREHAGSMLAAARGALGGSREHLGVSAEDVVISVFEELMPKGLPADVRNPRAFLITVTKRRAIDAARRAKRDLPDPWDDEAQHPNEAEPFEDRIHTEMLIVEALEALEDLPPQERHVLEERVMGKRTAKDVGADLGVSGQRVSQLQSAALGRIRERSAFTESPSGDFQEQAATAAADDHPTGPPA